MTISGTNITSNDSLTYVAKNRIYINKTHTYTQKGAENSLYQFCLTITKPFLSRGNEKRLSVSRTVNQVIMRVHKPTVAYKLALQDVVVTRRKQCFPQFELSFSLRVKYQFTFQRPLIFTADNRQKHRVCLEKCSPSPGAGVQTQRHMRLCHAICVALSCHTRCHEVGLKVIVFLYTCNVCYAACP